MKTIVELTDMLAVSRDSYKTKYKKLEAERDAALKEAKAGFIGKKLLEENANIKSRFNEDVEKLIEETKDFVEPYFEGLRAQEMAKVQRIDADTIRQLQSISDLPISTIEMSILADKFGGKSYFTDRILLQMAEKNAVTERDVPMLAAIAPTIDTRMSVLADLQGQLEKLMTDYDGSVHYQVEVLLADQILARAESKFNNGFADDMTAEQSAKRILLAIQNRAGSEFERGIILQNCLKNADDETRLEMLSLMASNSVRMSDATQNVAGCKAEVEEFAKDGSMAKYNDAKKAIKQIRKHGNEMEEDALVATLVKNADNPFFRGMVERDLSDNDRLTQAAEDANKTATSRDNLYTTSSLVVEKPAPNTPVGVSAD